MMDFGKFMEVLGRRIRPCVSPSYRKAYKQLLAREISEWNQVEPIVCFDLENQAIDAVAGRYYFSFVRDVIDAGYFPVFVAHRNTLSSFGISKMKSLLLRERLGVVRFPGELKQPHILITDRNDPVSPAATRVIQVDYTRRRCQSESDVPFPLFVHPKLTVAAKLPPDFDLQKRRPVRLFFGGNTDEKTYNRDVIRKDYHMLSRREMLSITQDSIRPGNTYLPQVSSTWLDSEEEHTFVICQKPYKLPQSRWLEAMTKADFFLACPGVHMPLCHNLVESMASGTIPILQYADYISPALENGVNCLTFHDETSLRAVIARIQSMEQQEIVKLRGNVQLHYQLHMASGQFARRLFASPHARQTLLLNEYRVPR